MKYLIIFSVMALSFFLPTRSWAGGDVGNGGDVISCKTSSDNQFKGILSLDYMLTLQNGRENELSPVSFFEDSLSRITKIMTNRCREDISTEKENRFSAALEKFIASRGNHTDFSQPYIWHAAAYGLVDIHDERLSRLLPINCQINGVPNIIQAIIRKSRPDLGLVVFEYDPTIESQLQPLQKSFLYVHEFLRNYTSDIDQIRWLNWFLHSKQMENLNDTDFRKSVNRLMANSFCRN